MGRWVTEGEDEDADSGLGVEERVESRVSSWDEVKSKLKSKLKLDVGGDGLLR